MPDAMKYGLPLSETCYNRSWIYMCTDRRCPYDSIHRSRLSPISTNGMLLRHNQWDHSMEDAATRKASGVARVLRSVRGRSNNRIGCGWTKSMVRRIDRRVVLQAVVRRFE